MPAARSQVQTPLRKEPPLCGWDCETIISCQHGIRTGKVDPKRGLTRPCRGRPALLFSTRAILGIVRDRWQGGKKAT